MSSRVERRIKRDALKRKKAALARSVRDQIAGQLVRDKRGRIFEYGDDGALRRVG